MNKYEEFKYKLLTVIEEKNIFINEPMKNHTSFKVGGPVDIMVIPDKYSELQSVVLLCMKNDVPFFIMGNGSNIVVTDSGIRGVVIKLTKLNKITVSGKKVVSQCGALLSDVSQKALEASLTGFEFACGIPGCVGGAVAMNAGAYISEIVNVIESALILDDKGDLKTISKVELELGHRSSSILKYGYTVLEATFDLMYGQYDEISSKIEDLQRRRKDKQPLEYASAGSTFKRPEGYYAAKLIEDAGLKGVCIGDAEVSRKHSGFIINKGNATAKDVLDLISFVQKTVYEQFGVELLTEVRILGEE